MNAVTPADIANQDQEVAQALHEAEMIAKVYERLATSLPEDFAREMTKAWFIALTLPDASDHDGCPDCGEMA